MHIKDFALFLFLALLCPLNNHYELCGAPCPTSRAPVQLTPCALPVWSAVTVIQGLSWTLTSVHLSPSVATPTKATVTTATRPFGPMKDALKAVFMTPVHKKYSGKLLQGNGQAYGRKLMERSDIVMVKQTSSFYQHCITDLCFHRGLQSVLLPECTSVPHSGQARETLQPAVNQPCPSTMAYILSSAPVHLCLSVDNGTIEIPQVMASLLLLCATLLFLSCPCKAMWAGKEFALSFMQNYQPNYDTPSFQLHITAVQTDTKVTVDVPSLNFREERDLTAGKGVTIPLPNKVELYGTGRSSNTVRIEASALITVTSSNNKLYTTDTSVILPINEWGTEYFIFTPDGSPYNTFKEFAVTNGNEPNSVEISPTGPLRYQGRTYMSGSRLQLDLQPFESVQLQSRAVLSGTQIVSKKPVAVFSGHSCTWRFSKCNHVYEQLLPVSKWGANFIIPPLSFQKKFDSVFIQASQSTRINVQTDKGKEVFSLSKGETKEITYHDPTTLAIEADHAVQVLLLFNGVTLGRNQFYDPFLTNIVPTNRFCSSYALQGLSGFDNQALIVAKTNQMLDIKVDGSVPKDVQWRKIEGTDYSWAKISYNPTRDGASPTVLSSSLSFGLYSIGLSQMNGYGAPAQCIKSGTSEEESSGGSPSCNTVTCSSHEACKMNDGYPSCVTKPKNPGTCWAMGDPHYRTFDGLLFNFMGLCTYIFSKNSEPSDSLPAFEVLAQNVNLGIVSHIGLVIVKVYDKTITVAHSEIGYIRIDNSRWALPVTLSNNKLVISQSGRSVLIQTDLGITVSYDWDNTLVVTASESYSGKTRGLCGNFNGNPNDDLTTPSGSKAASVVAFGSSWKVPGLDQGALCTDECVDRCERCEHSLLKRWEGEVFCGIITMVSKGPFRECHSVIDPQPYFENCKHDICMGEGLRHFLCKTLEAYTDACQNAGIVVHDWRKIARCPANCPANSHYELCGSACPPTCSDPDAPSKCKRPCV
ncbi:hypothetical protein NQD34_012134 [Periophthalmus magnuspinnatus]|nr:hypothetical protein NQD34_012134 [Periophthalmus magnuspinnatus]